MTVAPTSGLLPSVSNTMPVMLRLWAQAAEATSNITAVAKAFRMYVLSFILLIFFDSGFCRTAAVVLRAAAAVFLSALYFSDRDGITDALFGFLAGCVVVCWVD